MTHFAIPSSAEFLMQLVNPAARALVLAGGAGLALAASRAKTTSTRLFIWKTVLYSALAMPLLAWMLPAITVPMPSVFSLADQPPANLQPAIQSSRVDAHSFKPSFAKAKRTPKPALVAIPRTSSEPQVSSVPPRSAPPIHWAAIAAALYTVVAVLLLMRMVVGVIFARRLLRTAKAICDPRLAMSLARRARSFGLASIPACAESQVISVPVTMGVFRPTILLPADWQEWDQTKLDAVLAHEMAHVARRDALAQHLSLLHRAIFWFSPLAWWLDRHLAELAEQASDEAALSCGADSNDYAKALLGFLETLHAAPGRVWWQGVAMAKAGTAERRLERILAWNKEGALTMGLKKSVAAAILVFAVPTIFLAASVRPPHDQDTQAPPAPAKPSATVAAPNPPGVVISPRAVTSVAPAAPVTAIAPVAPVAAVGRLAPVSPLAPIAPFSRQSGHSYAYGYDDERFVIVSGKSDSLTMSGSTQDARHVERLRKQIPGDFIWFQRDEKSYIIRDQATIDHARSFWAPQEELGKKQEALGKQQEALGKQQEALGHKMEQVRVNVPDMTASLDKLKAELKALGSTATQDQLGRIQSEIGELQSRLGEMQSHAGEQQSKVGEEMSALGEQQSKLGEQQGELGRQQEEVAHQATQKMKELFDEAIKNGKAQPEPQTSQGGTI